jgi:hypothetical protein
MPAVSYAVRRTRRIPYANDFPLVAGVCATQPGWPLGQSGLSPSVWKQMKHYLDADGRCDGPSETKARRFSSQRARPSKHPCNFPLSGERGALCRGTRSPEEPPEVASWRDCAGKVDGDFCVPARYGLNASACGHAVQFPQLPALPRATWTLYARRPLQPAPVVRARGLLPTGKREPACGSYAQVAAPRLCDPGRGTSVVQHPLTF